MMLRWLTARGHRVTLLLAVLFAVFHVGNELRVLAGGRANFIQRLELTAQDVKLAFRGERDPTPWRVAVAAIDERALQRFGPLPWSRSRHAELVERLTALGAGAIAFDMTFDQPSEQSDRRALRAMADAYADSGLQDASVQLQREASRLQRLADRPRRTSRTVRKVARRAAETAATVAQGLARFEAGLDVEQNVDPDAAFSAAIQASGRVVLGIIAHSKQDADALAASGSDSKLALEQGLARVSSSTITSLIEDDGSGLVRIVDGQDHFRRGLYRRYFGLQPPADILAAATPHFGLINAVPDEDGVNRRMPLVAALKGTDVLMPSLALKAAQVALGADEIEVVGDRHAVTADQVRLGPRSVRTELGATTTLDWVGGFDPARFPIVSVVDLLDGTASADDVRGRVVFVAATAVGTHDQRVTPLEPAIPGVYIHATLAQNILEGRQLRRPPYVVLLEVLVLLIIGALAGLLMARFRLWGQLGTTVGLALAWLVVSQAVFVQGIAVATVWPLALIFASLLAMSMWSYLIEQRERRQTRRAFAQYLSPGVLDRVLAEPEEYLRLGGRRYDATVLFSDIRGFTTISEALTPEELGRLLNEYMTPMTNIVFRHQGTLDKYIGDAVMAFWGAPVEQEDHARRACRAALEMQQEVERLNERFTTEGLPDISIGIGLSSGPMTIGNMGSDDHFEYTAVGDRVNLGARLESQTKAYGVGIMISEATQRVVDDEMLCRELGAIRVVGKSEPVRIFELIGTRADHAYFAPFIQTFHRGLTLFQARKWDAAINHFSKARALRGGDKASELYIQWCADFKRRPPPANWDGVRVASQK